MTTWYFDSVLGSDSNAGTSVATAKQNYTTSGAAAGDTFLFKRGTTQTVTTSFMGLANGVSDSARARYGAYGTALVPYSIWVYGAASGNMILNGAQSKYIDFEDMYFDMRSTNCRNAINFAAQGANETVGNRLYRCFFQGSNTPVTHGGNGLNIVRESTASTWPRDYVIEDCEFFDNEGHGLILVGCRNIAVRRCKFYRNGLTSPTGGHGFSSGANKTTASSGWTNTPATTIWYRTLAAAELDVYYISTSVSGYTRVRRTAGTATAPGIGEYGVSGGILYININSASDPSGQSVQYAWGLCAGLVIEFCDSHDNYYNPASPFHEGHGFAFDDWAVGSFRRNKSYNNQGAGFSLNRGDGSEVFANIAYGNWQAAVVSNPTDGSIIKHNTFYGNNTGTGAHDAEIKFNGYCKDAIISNNIIVSSVAYGISRETTDTGFSGVTNGISGATTSAEKNTFVTGTITTAPALDANYRPAASTLKRTGTYLGGKDFYGKQFYPTPNIGAVDDHPLPAWAAAANSRP